MKNEIFEQIKLRHGSNILPLYKVIPPFMPFKEGYGFKGVILWDKVEDKIQCHICGRWLKFINHNHLVSHFLDQPEYREMTGLNATIALITRGLAETEKSIAKENYKVKKDKLIEGNKTYFAKHKRPREKPPKRIQYYNTFGTCDVQLKDRFMKITKELGRSPRKEEITFSKTLTKRFGSYNNALKAFDCSIYRKRPNYTKEQLLSFIQDFIKRYDRVPTVTDFRQSKLFPNPTTYQRNFGSWNKSLSLAGVK